MNVRQLLRDQRGVTLIDLILVIVIIGLAIPPMMGLLIQSTKSSTFGITATRGNSLGSTLLEEIRSKAWDENGGAASATLGPDSLPTSENGRADYDDVDDFHGLDESPPQDSLGSAMTGFNGFRQQVSVCYVASTDLDTCLGSGTSNYKRVAITISDPEGRTSQIITVISSF